MRRTLWFWGALVLWGCPEDPEETADSEPRDMAVDARVIVDVNSPPPPQDMGPSVDEGPIAPDVGPEDPDDGVPPPDAAPRAACSDGLDNDGDGLVDHPDDPGCDDPDDNSELDAPPLPQCDDRADNDGDGLIDLYDPDCSSEADPTEAGGNPESECANGIDDDENGFIDWPNDPGCHAAGDPTEGAIDVPACANALDDDEDGLTDYPNDPGCAGRGDRSEVDPIPPAECANGEDDDGNGVADYPDDPGCEAAGDPIEEGPCGAEIDLVDLNAWLAENPAYDGTTAGAPANSVGSCGGGAGGERYFVYRVDRPLEELRFSTDHPETQSPTVLYRRNSCLGPVDQQCDRGTVDQPGRTLTIERPDPGVYFIVVDTGARDGGGPFRLTVDAVGPPQCRDQEDNDGDGAIDIADCGCESTEDDDETDPVEAPVCCDDLDNDGDGTIDYPADEDCVAAGAPREEPLCPLDVGAIIEVGQDGGNFEMPILERSPGVAAGSCEFGASPEVLLVVTLDDPSDVFIDVLQDNMPVATGIHARTTCNDPMSETGCRQAVGMGPLSLIGLDRGVHFIFVEQGFLVPEAGRIATVVINSNIRACNNLEDDDGDGLIDLEDPGCEEGLDNSEVHDPDMLPQCADGLDNDMDDLVDWPEDDGCSGAGDDDEAPFCMLQRNVVQVPPAGGRFNYVTRGGMNLYEANCAASARGPEAIFAINVNRAVTITAEIVEADYDTALFMRGICDDAGSQLACDDDGGVGLLSRISVRVMPGTYFIFADGFGAGQGAGTLSITVQ